MGRILIKQGDKYIPSTDEDVKGMSEPLGRGSASLKKRLVKVGVRDGLPVYELRSLDEAPGEPTATPEVPAPKPTPGPMSVQPSDRDYLAPYRSQTPIPEFNLGITGATSTVPVKPGDRARGYQDPVAKAKAQTQAAKAKMKGAIRAPLKPKEFVGPMDPTTDAKRRWEERYLRADAPKPEPLDLSLPPPPPDAPEAKADPFAKYQVPTSSRESDLPPDDFSQNDQPGGEWVTTEGYQKNLKRPEGGDALGDLGVETPAPEAPVAPAPEGTPSPDLEGKLDEAGGGMFGERDFNDGEQPQGAPIGPTEPPKGLDKYRHGDTGTPITGRRTPMETQDTETMSTQTTGVVDQELLEKAKGGLDSSTARQEKALSDLERTINEQRGVDEEARGALATQRQGLLERYTQGLDDVAKARFMDTLVKNVGKIVAGGVGLGKGIDVASNYKYEGADTEGMRKDVDSAYAANLANLEAQEKERKGVSDKEFEMRKQLLDATIKLPTAQQAMIMDILNLQKLVTQKGETAQNLGWSDAKMDLYLEEIARKAEEAEKAGKFKERELWLENQRILASVKNAERQSRAAEKVSENQAKATLKNEGTKEQEKSKEESPELTERFEKERGALNTALFASPTVRTALSRDDIKRLMLTAKNQTGDARKATMKSILNELSKSFAIAANAQGMGRNKEEAAKYEMAGNLLLRINSTVGLDPEDLEDSVAMQAKFEQFLAAKGGKTREGSKEGSSSSTSVTGKIPSVVPQDIQKPKAATDLEQKIKAAQAVIDHPEATPENKKKAEAYLRTLTGK